MTPELAAVEPLGLTIKAGMLFIAGALGAWCRAVVSATQVTWSQRTFVDLLVGGCGGILLPIFQPAIDPLLHIKFHTWTVLQQSVLSLFLGGSGSFFWTAIGWRTGLIVTPKEAVTGGKPAEPPQVGILLGTREASRVREGQPQ